MPFPEHGPRLRYCRVEILVTIEVFEDTHDLLWRAVFKVDRAAPVVNQTARDRHRLPAIHLLDEELTAEHLLLCFRVLIHIEQAFFVFLALLQPSLDFRGIALEFAQRLRRELHHQLRFAWPAKRAKCQDHHCYWSTIYSSALDCTSHF